MFDIKVHEHRHVTERVHENVTVHEHRAPTDESVRLLREMEQAAADKIVQAIRLENCPIDCVIHVGVDSRNAQMQYLAIVKINGRRIKVEENMPMDATVDEVAQKLLKATSEAIASAVLSPAFVTMARQMRGV